MPVLNGTQADALLQAAQRLAQGDLVGLPTETVYGLAARADDDAAVAKIYAAKGRPADHPLIVHVVDEAQAQVFAAQWPESARRLAKAFWPGPVTVIVPRRPGVANASAAQQDTVGLRCPSHPVAQALLRQAAGLGVAGVSAPSANRFGRVSPTHAAHVESEFGEDLLILDGGDCDVGIESVIVDCTREHPVLLRPGRLTRAELEAALGDRLRDRDQDSPKASGTLPSHYAPRAKVRLMSADMLRQALSVLPSSTGDRPTVAVYSRTVDVPSAKCPHRAMPDDAVQVAHDLFAALRALDDTGAALIWIESPPALPAWEGVLDRLQRAAAA